MANERIEDKKVASQKSGDDSESDDEEKPTLNHRRSKTEPSTGDLLHHDMGTGLPFRPATFDGCISISALQWLCYSNTKDQVPKRRLMRFFSSLYKVLRRGARAVLQFYPETSEHAILISECAARVGFAGGIVVDYPNSTKAKKHYLVLSFEGAAKAQQGLAGDTGLLSSEGQAMAGVRVADKDPRRKGKQRGKNAPKKIKGKGKTKEWILHKKETQRKQGKETRKDTKYTGRKRPTRF